jgi:flagellar basal body-associated protein FliL
MHNTCGIMRTMKKLITVVVVLLLAGALAGFAISMAEDHYVKNKQSQPAPVATITVAESHKEVVAAQLADQKKYQALVDSYNLQTTECAKGKVAYDKLTPTIKSSTPAPVCSQPIELTSPAE